MEAEQGQADRLGMEAERALDLQAQSSLLPIMQPLNHEPIGPIFPTEIALYPSHLSIHISHPPQVPSFQFAFFWEETSLSSLDVYFPMLPPCGQALQQGQAL